jgi:hypothetical protein
LEVLLCRLVSGTSVYKMNLWETLWRTRGWVDMKFPEISTIVESLVDGQVGKVLVAKRYNLTLGNKSSELVLACRTELAELDTCNLSADRWSQIVGNNPFGEQLWVTGVCV